MAGIVRDQLAGALKQQALLRRFTVIPSAQVLALFATPVLLVPAPGLGNILEFDHAWLEHRVASPAVAYAGIAVGEDLVIKYTNAAGQTVSEVQELTGWLDQTVGATKRISRRPEVAGTLGVYTENAPLVAHILVGEITTGTGSIIVETWYRIRQKSLRAELA